MTTEYPGRGNARRSLELLWGVRRAPRRGPKPGLSVDRVIEAAIDLADREGLTALSMRRVADELGVGAMSLYTYVPAKAELLDLMLDAVFGEQVAELEAFASRPGEVRDAEPAAEGHGGGPGVPGWRAGLEARARIDWALAERHPWLTQVSSSRAILGPNETSALDRSLRFLVGTGLTAREMVAAVDTVAMFANGVARRAVETREAPRRTGMTDDEWWREREPLMAEFYDWARFPTVIEVAAAGGFDEPAGTVNYLLQFLVDDFEFGLQRLLDGIGALIEARTNRP